MLGAMVLWLGSTAILLSDKKETTVQASEEKVKGKTDAKEKAKQEAEAQAKAQQQQATSTTSGQTSFANCTELNKIYPNGVASDHPAYKSKMDRDKDGYACERN